MAATSLLHEPVARYGHIAAVVNSKLHLWGGLRRDLNEIHDGPDKTAFTSVVDILDPQVYYWWVVCVCARD